MSLEPEATWWCDGRQAEDRSDPVLQSGPRQRLHDIAVGADLRSEHDLLLARFTGDEERGDRLQRRMSPHRRYEVEAIQARHLDVRDHEVVGRAVKHVERGLPVRRLIRFGEADLAQQLADDPPRGAEVIDDEEAKVAVAHGSGVEEGAGPSLGGELDNAPAPAPRRWCRLVSTTT